MNLITASGLSYADLALFNVVEDLMKALQVDGEVLSGKPNLVAILDKVRNNSRISEWLKTRPQTLF